MTVPTYASNTRSTDVSANTINITWPSSLASGDMVLLFVGTNQPVLAIGTPSGFTKITEGNQTGNFRGGLFYKIATGSESGTFSLTHNASGGSAVVYCVRYALAGGTAIEAAFSIGSASAASWTAIGINTGANNETLVAFVYSYATVSATPPTGMTARSTNANDAFFDVAQTTAGASGDKVGALGASNAFLAALVGIKQGNTAPTITAGPTTTYAVGSDTRPSNTWGITFTATDAEQAALTYYIRTSATWAAGTQVATGTCTSGTSKVLTGLLYNASGLVEGSQTLYLHIYDGTDHTVSASSFSLTVHGLAPVAVLPGVLATSLTAYAPFVINPKSASPTTLATLLDGKAPAVSVGKRVSPSTAALLAVGFTPTVLAPRLVSPTTLAVLTQMFAPTVHLDKFARPVSSELVTATFAPTIDVTHNALIRPVTAQLPLATFAPIVIAVGLLPRVRIGGGYATQYERTPGGVLVPQRIHGGAPQSSSTLHGGYAV